MRNHIQRTDGGQNQEITKETSGQFLFALQQALLLTLKEEGILDDAQCQWAEAYLEKQRRPVSGGILG